MSPEIMNLIESANVGISAVFLVVFIKLDRRFSELNTNLALIIQKVAEHEKRIDKVEEKVDEKQDK